MKFKKFTALLLAALLVLSLAACGTKDNDKKADMSSNDSAMTDEPKNAEEALALHKKLMEQENTILSQNTALWEKVFMAADKVMTLQEDGKNYGEFLLDTIEGAKDQFTDEEYEMLKESATEISNIENKLTELENKYPEIMQESIDGDMSVPAGMLISPSMDSCMISGYFSSNSVSLFSILLISVVDSFSHSYSLSVNCSLAASTVSSRKSP